MSRRVLVVCPGRGTYTPDDLGSLARRLAGPGVPDAAHRVLEAADRFRAEVGSAPISDLDAAPRYQAALHLKGENAGPLIFTATAVDWAILPRDRFRPVCVAGNSMGWYSALHCGGVFDFGDALRVVDTMSKTQGDRPLGGQLILPWVDEDWRPRPEKRREIEAYLAELRSRGLAAEISIDLGGYLVLAGDDAAIAAMKKELPVERQGERDYPFQLAQHAAFHTGLMAEPSRMGREALVTLPWRGPALPLVDGAGRVRRPGIATDREIYEYTLVEQVLCRYDFTRSLRVALREYAPDAIVLLGPGASLGGAIGQTLALEGWRGIRSRGDFARVQKSDDPVLISMGRADQYERFVAEALSGR
ncbi:MAG: ACP S-malonyltransferase [Planctomycetota bacterium]